MDRKRRPIPMAWMLCIMTIAGLDAPAQTPVQEETPTMIEIDGTVRREPISKYIYGQFIEHLGRCIYGGMWAELVSDRKFLRPITDDYNPWGTGNDRNWRSGPFEILERSPWKVLGPAGSVTMDAAAPFVGEHTPVIALAGDGTEGGIGQERVGAIGGKTLTGRLVLAGDASAAPIYIRLREGKDVLATAAIDSMPAEYEPRTFSMTPTRSTHDAWLEIVSNGGGSFRIGAVSLMRADNIDGWRPDTVALLKELNSPVYRWPGGNFVSGYDWRDGIGPPDKRPPRPNPAWSGIEPNDVGIHEFMRLMELIDSEAFIAVNTGNGSVPSAAEEVQYLNGSPDTPMGKLRTGNGRTEPWDVKWWAVGNEMYGSWQIGNVPLEQYVTRHNDFAKAMWAEDPSLQLIGVGNMGDWSIGMMTHCSDYMNLISEHIYRREGPDPVEHAARLAEDIKRRADEHRGYRAMIPQLDGKDIRIAMDEWNYWYGPYIYGELGVQYHMKDALGVARGLHEYFRHSNIYFMANYAQTVNVIGAIKTSGTDAVFDTTGLVLKLYRAEFGTLPMAVEGDLGDLDVSAAWTSDKKAVTLAVVNPTAKDRELKIDWNGVELGPEAQVWTIANPDPMSFNAPNQPPQVTIGQETVHADAKSLTAPATGVRIYRFGVM
jgi:alpha-N-arabinofuranosidase